MPRYRAGSWSRIFRCGNCRRQSASGGECTRCGAELPRKPSSYRASITIAGLQERKAYPTFEMVKRWLEGKSIEKVDVEAGRRRRAQLSTATYGELLPLVLAHYRQSVDREYSSSTLATYERELARVVHYWGRRRVAETRRRDVREWIAHLRQRGGKNGRPLSTSSVRHLLDRLSTMHEVAVELDLIEDLPCTIRRPKYRPLQERKGTPEVHLEQLVDAARADFDKRALPAVLLAADAGLSCKELLLLRGEDVRFDVRGLRYGYVDVASRGASETPKWGRIRRVPILTERLHDALRNLSRSTGKRLLGVSTRDGLVGIVSRTWRAALGPDARPQFHQLRHRCATWMAERGVASEARRQILGHTTTRTTDLYTHVERLHLPDQVLDVLEAPARRGHLHQGQRGPRVSSFIDRRVSIDHAGPAAAGDSPGGPVRSA